MARGKPNNPGQTPDMEKLQAWVESGPLYSWRTRYGVSRPQCAAIMTVGSTTIWQWEHAAAIPTKEHMAELVRILGPETVERWGKWVAGKPRVV